MTSHYIKNSPSVLCTESKSSLVYLRASLYVNRAEVCTDGSQAPLQNTESFLQSKLMLISAHTLKCTLHATTKHSHAYILEYVKVGTFKVWLLAGTTLPVKLVLDERYAEEASTWQKPTRVLIGDSSPSMADRVGSGVLCKCIIPVGG